MITKDSIETKACVFCASDFHLEMILLPYIAEQIESKEFVILTQNDLEESIQKVLERVNLDSLKKNDIIGLNWKKKNVKDINEFIKTDRNVIVIINGDGNYIKQINTEIRKKINCKIDIVDCFHIGDSSIDINEISKNYDIILNTRKI